MICFARTARVAVAALAWILIAGIAAAQQIPNFERFDSFARSVGTSIENDRLPDEGFESLRDALEDWREEFEAAQDVNAVRIDELDAQIAALGAPPADGSDEPAAIAERRAELQGQMQDAMSPRIEAEESRARAEALIRQIDAILRGRQADTLLELGRTPLDPTLWGGAAASLLSALGAVQSEIAANLAATQSRAELWQRIAIAVLLVAAAVVLVVRGPRLVERWLARLEGRSDNHSTVLAGFLLSLGGVLSAVLAVTILNVALISTGILGEAGTRVSIGINLLIVSYAVARWLGRRLFPVTDNSRTPINLEAGQRAKGRSLASLLGILTGLVTVLQALADAGEIKAEALGVLLWPLLVFLGVTLFRLGKLLRASGPPAEGEEVGFSGRLLQMLGFLVQCVAIAGPVAATIGFQNLAVGLLMPGTTTLAALGFLASLHFAIRAAYGLLRGLDAQEAKQALAPVLISFALVLAAIPSLSLLWGARETDLSQAWETFKRGIPLGETAISPGALMTFALIFAIGFGLTRLVQGTMRSSVLPRTKIDKGGRNAIVSGLGYLGITIAAIAGITAAGIDLSSFAIIIGALGVGIGFGLQNIVNNFVSGIILLIERPISEGDWVEVNGKMGIVQAISVRSTRIQTFDRTDVIVPNGDLISGTVTNWTRGDSVGRIIVPVGVAYGTDTRKVEAILMEIASAHPIVSMNPEPAVVFKGFGADSMDFEIRAILSDINFGLSATSDINHEIARRFAEEGIEIPFAQRDVWLRNPETIAASSQSKRPPSAPVDPALGGLDGGED